MDLDTLEESLEEVLPAGFKVDIDESGQVVIYTGLCVDEDDGQLVEFVGNDEDEDDESDPDFEPLEDEDDQD